MRCLNVPILALACGLFTATARADCPGDIPIRLNWCSGDHGFNEGAACGLSALSSASLTGLPPMANEAVLGNTWDRTNMMSLAIVAFHRGAQNQATAAAICCQVHNASAHACLASRPDLVREWLQRH